jgi:hypothetical protein
MEVTFINLSAIYTTAIIITIIFFIIIIIIINLSLYFLIFLVCIHANSVFCHVRVEQVYKQNTELD